MVHAYTHIRLLALLSVCRLVRNRRLAINEQNYSSCQKSTQKNAGKRYERNSRVESGIVIKHRNACMKVVRFSFAWSSVSPDCEWVQICNDMPPVKNLARSRYCELAIATKPGFKSHVNEVASAKFVKTKIWLPFAMICAFNSLLMYSSFFVSSNILFIYLTSFFLGALAVPREISLSK